MSAATHLETVRDLLEARLESTKAELAHVRKQAETDISQGEFIVWEIHGALDALTGFEEEAEMHAARRAALP
jgi:hypothetical protein